MLYCDDGDDQPPEVRKWRPADCLVPEPPRNWLIAAKFVGPVHPIEVGVWLCLLDTVQKASREHKSRLHTVSRDEHGTRVLLVHPKIRKDVEETVDFVHGAVTGCDCGGGDCLAGELQEAAAKVIARRRWKEMPMADRIGYLQDSESDADLALAFDGLDAVVALGHPDIRDELAYHG